jgi:MEMO1 family protein
MIRQPAVAGLFYPADAKQLQQTVDHYLKEAKTSAKVPKAIIAPHAGYVYSGPIAASAYARLQTSHAKITRVVLIGPSHRVSFRGMAVSRAETFATPLGNILVDHKAIVALLGLPFVQVLEQAHAQEHCLEVQLPFLQATLDDFKIVPIVVGSATPEQVGQVIEAVWGGAETLVVISSDLSHYLDYCTAQSKDKQTSGYIESLQYDKLDFESACGRVPITGLLKVAKEKGLAIKTIDLRNSGDTAGDKARVVGYGAYVVE